jgi:hypothetical protein
MSVERYVVEKGSSSGHCCFDWTVKDMAKPWKIGRLDAGFETVCECFEEADARLVADALNCFSITRVLPDEKKPV